MSVVYILNPTRDPMQTWVQFGRTREEAMRMWNEAVDSGKYQRPMYRVVITTKALKREQGENSQ